MSDTATDSNILNLKNINKKQFPIHSFFKDADKESGIVNMDNTEINIGLDETNHLVTNKKTIGGALNKTIEDTVPALKKKDILELLNYIITLLESSKISINDKVTYFKKFSKSLKI